MRSPTQVSLLLPQLSWQLRAVATGGVCLGMMASAPVPGSSRRYNVPSVNLCPETFMDLGAAGGRQILNLKLIGLCFCS